MYLSDQYQPAVYCQQNDGEFEVVDQTDSEKVCLGVCLPLLLKTVQLTDLSLSPRSRGFL